MLSQRERCGVRRLILRLGDHEASDRLGFDVQTLYRMAAQLPISPDTAARLRKRYPAVHRADEL
jgi:hypothetical protein